MGFSFSGISPSSWLLMRPYVKNRTTEENFYYNYSDNIEHWNKVNEKIQTVFENLGYTTYSNYQHMPSFPGDLHVIYHIFRNEEYFVEIFLKDGNMESRVYSNHYCFSEKDIPFMQTFYVTINKLLYENNHFNEVYERAVDILNKSIDEYKQYAHDTIRYKENIFDTWKIKNT